MVSGPEARLGGVTRWVGVAGGRIAVEVSGTGPALILLHGWTLDRRMWAAQHGALSSRFQMVTLDRRGFGQSTAPFAPAHEGDDIVRIADALGLDGLALIGMSQAGSAAILCARQHRDRVAALVLQGISLADVPDTGPEDERIPLDSYTRWARAGRLGDLRAHWQRHALMAGLSGASRDRCMAMLVDYDARDLIAPAGPGAPGAGRDDVRDLPMPVLAITGARDTAWRRQVTQAAGSCAPDGRAVLIPGAGHLCNMTHPEAYNAEVKAFLLTAAAHHAAA